MSVIAWGMACFMLGLFVEAHFANKTIRKLTADIRALAGKGTGL